MSPQPAKGYCELDGYTGAMHLNMHTRTSIHGSMLPFVPNTPMQQASLTSPRRKTDRVCLSWTVNQLKNEHTFLFYILIRTSIYTCMQVQSGLPQKSHLRGLIKFGIQLSGLFWETSKILFLMFITFLSSRSPFISSTSFATAKAFPKGS